MNVKEIMPGLFLIEDTCNVYLICHEGDAIAIDFGSGRWLDLLPQLGVRKLSHVFLTHHHEDQCAGLLKRKRWPFIIHAPQGEEAWLSAEGVQNFRRKFREYASSRSILPRGVPGIRYDMSGFNDVWWDNRRIRLISTPGHGPNALSIVLTHGGKQIIFCGDAAHAKATIWQPWQLEWDHWTGTGALAAWEGIQRIANLGMDLLCPSHGPVIREKPRTMLRQLAAKLLKFYHAKGQICVGEPDDYWTPEMTDSGTRRLLPHLYQFGFNSYLVLSDAGEAMIIDPWSIDLAKVDSLLKELGNPKITVATATHFHFDHTDGLPLARKRFGAKIWLHPIVAKPLREHDPDRYPYLPPHPIRPDHVWPEDGTWRWNEYQFQIAPFPGQTWWHGVFQTQIDGCQVLFGGDNFQPPSRCNGTGGFCAFNGCRFDGFATSARQVIRWKPDLIAAGHGAYYRFHKRQFQKIIAWSQRAQLAIEKLCPSGNLEIDYYVHPL